MASFQRIAHLTTLMDLSQIISLEAEDRELMVEVAETRVPREMQVREEQAVDAAEVGVGRDSDI